MEPGLSVTQLLVDWNNGDEAALPALMDAVYNELRKLARSYLRRERSGQTLQTTALVHEAFLRLVDQNRIEWKNRAHFFGIAARCMRRILVDRARRKKTAKRGGGAADIVFDERLGVPQGDDIDVVRLNDALDGLAQIDERQAKVVELRFFGGLDIEEAAEVLSVSPATVKREWRSAKAWLHRELDRS